ncbi:UNVERIFIED_CONTAM: (+)-neomenthol dehydrogenase [Sesamum angustifolium]|uniref:(+)-neomenthol dehydrogenase n=1 Tax=Sesamum angustifolium TaxID=2727405 RepID=A0AAW2P188_9LAMI
MMRRWWSKDTVAIVTGANKGIGFALVRRLAEVGMTVVLTARDTGRGVEAAELLRREGLLNVHFFQLDVANPNSIKTFAAWFQEAFGVVDMTIYLLLLLH